MNHIVLLGDSVFDNASYVKGGPDVIRQLQAKLPDGGRATLCAIDGSMVQDVKSQLSRLPPDATHLVVSAGGNDALNNVNILGEKALARMGSGLRFAILGSTCEMYPEWIARMRSGLRFAILGSTCEMYPED
jgi:hypothetical protein